MPAAPLRSAVGNDGGDSSGLPWRVEQESEIEARVEERGDLVDRIHQGDTLALGELLEHATGAKPRSVKVTVPRPAAPAAGG